MTHKERVLSKMDKDDRWIVEHFEELVDNYAGKWIAVANEELFVGEDSKEVDDNARKKYPKIIPSVLHVPKPEALECVL